MAEAKEAKKKESYLSRVKKILFQPSSFFKSVEQDTDYSKIMFFYVKMAIAAAIVSLICSLIVLSVQNNLAGAGILSLIINGIISIGLAFLVPFVASFIVQIGVWIFRGKQGYYNTYKAVTYPLTIVLIYGILSTIIVSIIGIALPSSLTQDQLTSNPALIFQETGFLVSLIVALGILLISLIHTLCIQVVGVARFQKMSKLRAFFSIILIPLIIIIIVFIILFSLAKQLAATPLS